MKTGVPPSEMQHRLIYMIKFRHYKQKVHSLEHLATLVPHWCHPGRPELEAGHHQRKQRQSNQHDWIPDEIPQNAEQDNKDQCLRYPNTTGCSTWNPTTVEGKKSRTIHHQQVWTTPCSSQQCEVETPES